MEAVWNNVKKLLKEKMDEKNYSLVHGGIQGRASGKL